MIALDAATRANGCLQARGRRLASLLGRCQPADNRTDLLLCDSELRLRDKQVLLTRGELGLNVRLGPLCDTFRVDIPSQFLGARRSEVCRFASDVQTKQRSRDKVVVVHRHE